MLPTKNKRTMTVIVRIVSVVTSIAVGLGIIWLLNHLHIISIDRAQKQWELKAVSNPDDVILSEPGAETTGHYYKYDPVLGWKNIPNWSSTTFGRTLTINAHGLRGSLRHYTATPNARRILILGDSFAWGYGVADSEIFTEQLETLLKPDDTQWQVINAGVSGWSPDQEYLWFRDEGVRYRPAIVVLAYCLLNDTKGMRLSQIYGLNKPFLTSTNLEFANIPVPKPEATGRMMVSTLTEKELNHVILHAIGGLSGDFNAPFVVMKFGEYLVPGDPTARAMGHMLQSIVSQIPNAYYLDLDASFLARSLAERDLVDHTIQHDGHWSASGHEVVAEILYDFLHQSNLLNP